MLVHHLGLVTHSFALIERRDWGTPPPFFFLIKQMYFSMAFEPKEIIILNTVAMSKVS